MLCARLSVLPLPHLTKASSVLGHVFIMSFCWEGWGRRLLSFSLLHTSDSVSSDLSVSPCPCRLFLGSFVAGAKSKVANRRPQNTFTDKNSFNSWNSILKIRSLLSNTLCVPLTYLFMSALYLLFFRLSHVYQYCRLLKRISWHSNKLKFLQVQKESLNPAPQIVNLLTYS